MPYPASSESSRPLHITPFSLVTNCLRARRPTVRACSRFSAHAVFSLMNTSNRQGKRASPDDHESSEWSEQSGGQSSSPITERATKKRRVREATSTSEEAPAAFLPPAWLERTWGFTKNLLGLASPGEQNNGLMIRI